MIYFLSQNLSNFINRDALCAPKNMELARKKTGAGCEVGGGGGEECLFCMEEYKF